MCCNPLSPKGAAGICLRAAFGVSLVMMGIIHYTTIKGYALMSSEGLGPLEMLGTAAAYILPALMIIGGALIAIGKFMPIGAWVAGVALAVIAPGLLLKSVMTGVSPVDLMPMVINTFVWILLYYFAVKSACCCGSGSCGTEK